MSGRGGQCKTQSTMLSVSWAFAVVWVIMLVVWCLLIAVTCRNARRRGADGVPRAKCQPMQWLMLIVPIFHCGDAIWQLWTYTHCVCMQCVFRTLTQFLQWKAWEYTVSLGRLSALLLCLYCISTGAGTVRPHLTIVNIVLLILLFGGFLTATALGLPLTVAQLGIDSTAAFVASLVMYGLILMVILREAFINSKVLKAQLLMIRHQGIDPRTTPTFHKFKLFTRLRRWVFGYFVLHTFIIITQVMEMRLWQRILLLVIWEITQLAITGAIGWLFKSSNKAGNVYLEREQHLPIGEVVHVVEAQEVTLGWNDGADIVVAEDGVPVGTPRAAAAASAAAGSHSSSGDGGGGASDRPTNSLLSWQEGMAVPPPPQAPAIISIFPVQRSRGRRRNQTRPDSGGPVQGVPVGLPSRPAPEMQDV